MVALSFYVPNFTENTPTLIVKNSRTIKPTDIEGQKLIQKIDNLTLHGIKLAEESNIRILHNRRAEFYIKLITDQKDLTDRYATIVIYGKLPNLTWEYGFEDWVLDVIDEVKAFSSEINRSAQPAQLRAIQTELKTIHFKYKQRKLLVYKKKLALALIIPIVLGLIVYVVSFVSQFLPDLNLNTVLLVSYFISINNVIITLLVQEKNL